MVSRPDTEWEAWFADERARLLDAMGWLADGGLVEQIQPLDAGALPGAPRAVGLSTWPFPPEPQTVDALQTLGYAPVAGADTATTRHFVRDRDEQRLLVAESGCDAWGDALLLQQYGAVVAEVRPHLAALRMGAAPRALLDEAARWWIDATGFGPLHALAAEMVGCTCDWAVGSGWAIDLFLGRVTRVHHDIDLIVDRRDQFALRVHLAARLQFRDAVERQARAMAAPHAYRTAAPPGPRPPRKRLHRHPAHRL